MRLTCPHGAGVPEVRMSQIDHRPLRRVQVVEAVGELDGMRRTSAAIQRAVCEGTLRYEGACIVIGQ